MVSNGFAESLERPGGLYTGMDELPPGVTRQRLQLLKRAAPPVSRVASGGLMAWAPDQRDQYRLAAKAELPGGFGARRARLQNLLKTPVLVLYDPSHCGLYASCRAAERFAPCPFHETASR
jgi:hypothetical protein